ncbi:MAG TPA: DUF5615 family PIN-like protein [Candidatus Bathyarchaeia archaeon]|nr:DUF5615 family PIN-like protein [Candidatus Bathyarchaeia archaeon]
MVLKKAKFLLDENVPLKLKQLFTSHNLSCDTVRDLQWLGIRNGALSQKVIAESYILVTRDKDFTFLWEKYSIQVIYLSIEPALLSSITPPLELLLSSWHYDLNHPFLLILQTDSIRFRK